MATGRDPLVNRFILANIERRSKREGCPFIWYAGKRDSSTVLLNYQTSDGKAKTVTAHFGLEGMVRLVEALKDVRLVFEGNAIAGVNDFASDHSRADFADA